MKNSIILLLCLSISIFSCEKNGIDPVPSSVNVINAAVNAGAVKVNYFGSPISWSSYSTQISSNSNGIYTMPTGTAVPLVIVPVNDTLHPIFDNHLSLNPFDIYSLYLIGQNPNYESLLIKEVIPKITFPDSSLNVRVINLSPNSPPVNVTLSTSSTINEYTNLAYKQASEFKPYPAKSTNGPSYTFQIRNASTNALISSSSVTLNTYRFHSITLVLRGLVAGSPAAGITIVKNY